MSEGSPPPTCHVSHVTCHVSCVTCNLANIKKQEKIDKVVELVGEGSVINGAYPSSFEFIKTVSFNYSLQEPTNLLYPPQKHQEEQSYCLREKTLNFFVQQRNLRCSCSSLPGGPGDSWVQPQAGVPGQGQHLNLQEEDKVKAITLVQPTLGQIC